MGTRNLTIVILNNEPKIAQYGQWDGYPSGQGAKCLQFLKKCDLKKFKDQVSKVSFLSEKEIEVIYNSKTEIPSYLSRNKGAEILDYVYNNSNVKLVNNYEFAADSLLCEWAYLIDFDKNTFEIYRGFVHKPHTGERFSDMEIKKYSVGDYYPIKLVKNYSLSDLPTLDQMVADCEDNDND